MRHRKRQFTTRSKNSKKRKNKDITVSDKSQKYARIRPVLFLLILFFPALYFYAISDDFISLTALESINPASASGLYTQDGTLIHKFYKINRTNVPIHRIPEHVINALIATEDRNFYNHWGVDLGLLNNQLTGYNL